MGPLVARDSLVLMGVVPKRGRPGRYQWPWATPFGVAEGRPPPVSSRPYLAEDAPL